MAERADDKKAPRFRVELEAKFRFVGTFQWTDVTVVNLSSTGLCLQTRAELLPGDLIEMEIETFDSVQHAHRRRLVATVQWRRWLRYGLKFG